MNKLPIKCPSCESALVVSKLTCSHCETGIAGNFTLPVLLQLSEEDQSFIFEFILASGSLKKMALQMKKSYPTVRNKLDDIIASIKHLKMNKL